MRPVPTGGSWCRGLRMRSSIPCFICVFVCCGARLTYVKHCLRSSSRALCHHNVAPRFCASCGEENNKRSTYIYIYIYICIVICYHWLLLSLHATLWPNPTDNIVLSESAHMCIYIYICIYNSYIYIYIYAYKIIYIYIYIYIKNIYIYIYIKRERERQQMYMRRCKENTWVGGLPTKKENTRVGGSPTKLPMHPSSHQSFFIDVLWEKMWFKTVQFWDLAFLYENSRSKMNQKLAHRGNGLESLRPMPAGWPTAR